MKHQHLPIKCHGVTENPPYSLGCILDEIRYHGDLADANLGISGSIYCDNVG